MGTATSIGPPLALLYQHHEGPALRATLAATFALGTGLSIVGLALAGAIEGWHLWLAAALLPGTLAGVAASNRLVGRVDGAWLRPAVLVFAPARRRPGRGRPGMTGPGDPLASAAAAPRQGPPDPLDDYRALNDPQRRRQVERRGVTSSSRACSPSRPCWGRYPCARCW